jgi:hypothetical protein
MTSMAVLKVEVTAEGPPAVVTAGAGVVHVGEVYEGPRRADLSFLREASSVVVAIGASEPLTPAVLRVTEGQSKSRGFGRSATIGLLIVTDSARGKIASVSLSVRRVAAIALIMR